MISHFTRCFRLPLLLGVLLTLSGCLYDYAPSGSSRGINTWLLGQWVTQDKEGHQFTAVVTRASSDHYKVTFQGHGVQALEFGGWISRVDGFSILVLRSLNQGATFGKIALYHDELLSPEKAPPGGIGATRIRLSELQLDESTRSLEPIKLRAAIRSALKNGTLLVPHDVVADVKEAIKHDIVTDVKAPQKSKQEQIPGSIIWTKTGGVTFQGEAF
jgi:hypothetical protein